MQIPTAKYAEGIRQTDQAGRRQPREGGSKGLGLGLQLVYEFVEMVGGRVNAASEEGKGSRFTVQLPLFESKKSVVHQG